MIRRTALKRKPMKPAKKYKTVGERKYHDHIAAMPCINCGKWPVHVHHVISDGYSRITRNHKLVLPVCPHCHQDGIQAIHKIGTANWNALTGIDQLERARQLRREWDG